jgi:hypothetical protein
MGKVYCEFVFRSARQRRTFKQAVSLGCVVL